MEHKSKSINLKLASLGCNLIIASFTFCFSLNLLAEPVYTKSGGSSAGSNISTSSKGVPYYSSSKLKSGKDIPLLSIGTEESISLSNAFKDQVSEINKLTVEIKKVQKINNTEKVIIKSNQLIVNSAASAKSIKPTDKPEIPPALPQFENVPVPNLINPEVKLIEYNSISSNEYKLYQSLILLDNKKQNEMAMGLLIDVLDDKNIGIEAQYHYGRTAKEMGLSSEFRYHVLTAANRTKDKSLKENALRILADNMKYLEVSDIFEIEKLSDQLEVDLSQFHKYQLARGKYFLDKGDLTIANDALSSINEGTSSYREARISMALLEYRRGNLDGAIKILSEHQSKLKKDDDLYSLNAVTLGRMYFQKSKFKEAYQAYLNVSKNSGHWLPAMVESAWAQILIKDYEGAAGNMFSLHTDFFKYSYAPESYIVRAVGYLNLCQYGDAMSVIEMMKRKYSVLEERLVAYKKANKTQKYYETLKLWAQNPQLKEADGLPKSFLVELASHPTFTSVQREINNLSDEAEHINTMTLRLINLEKEFLARIATIQKAKDILDKDKPRLISQVKLKIELTKKARSALSSVRKRAVTRMDKEKDKLKVLAAKALENRFAILQKQVKKILEQYDALQYEIYSGASDHVRYQMAGGEENAENREQLKPEDKKALKWKFQGEIWEDEIGHFRSSLKNVCPTNS